MGGVTIKDVAELAEVSPSTVSRVINDDDRITADTKSRVREAMRELGYYPNEIARSLVKQKPRSIGLVLSRPADRAMANPFFPDVIRGIASVLQSRQYQLTLTAAEDYSGEVRESLRLLRNGSIAGLIVMAARVNGKLLENLTAEGYPFVLIGRSQDEKEIPRVDNDNVKAARRMTELCLQHGYRRLALITGPEDYVVSQDRQKGYRHALKAAGISFDPGLVYRSEFTFDAGLKTAERMLAESNIEMDAVFATDDLLAMAVHRVARDRGLKIPRDLGLAGFNDAPLASMIEPALSTVRIPIVNMGEKAAEMLIKLIEKRKYSGEEIIVPAEIIERFSL